MRTDLVSVYGVGDVVPDWPNPEVLFEHVDATLKQADILFGQLEVPLANCGQRQSHLRSARRVPAEKASALVSAGFDVVSFASNHALDLGEDAFLETLRNLKTLNIPVIGAGEDIERARAPLIIDCKGTRIAFLSYCCVLPKGYDAGVGRPGCAPIKISTAYEQIDWQPGTPPRIITLADKAHLAALKADVEKAKSLAHIVIVSMHWGVHFVPSVLAMYEIEVGHAAIDAGADLVLGHHPHLVKAVEVYRGKVIFYSLGNFVVPSTKGRESEGRLHYNVEPDPNYPYYPYPVDARKTMIAKCLVSKDEIVSVSFLPCYINPAVQPERLNVLDPRFDETWRYVEQVSRQQGIGTQFSVEGDEVLIRI